MDGTMAPTELKSRAGLDGLLDVFFGVANRRFEQLTLRKIGRDG